MTIVVAVTGGIGSGKSTFSNEVKKRGLKLLDSDEEVLQIYKKPTKEFLKYLVKIKLGKSIKEKRINKNYISKIIFSNKDIKLKLEKYIFKIIRENRKKFIKKEKKRKTKIIFLDIPLLFENNLSKNFDIVITILSLKKERYKRINNTRNMSKELFNKIIKNQTTDLVRKNNSDIIIKNNNTLKLYLKKINNVLDQITI